MTIVAGRLHLALGMLVLCLSAPMAFACSTPPESAAWKQAMVEWINAQRRAKGRTVLAADVKLDRVAQRHACAMAADGRMLHQVPGGPDFGQRLKSAGYQVQIAAENIARLRNPGPERAAEIWRSSPGHWVNVLNPRVNEVGIGLAMAGGRYYWVMNVGREY